MEWESPEADLTGHVVICNASDKVRRIVEELHAAIVKPRPDVVLVLQEEAMWNENPQWHPDETNPFTREHFFVLDCCDGDRIGDRLRRVNIGAARAAVILADPRQGTLADARSTLVAVSIEHENPQVHTVMELISSVNRAHLRATDVNEVVCQGEIAERLISQSCITPGVKNIFQSLLTNAPGTNNIYISPVPEAAHGVTYRELSRQLILSDAPVILYGFIRPRPQQRSSQPPRWSQPPGSADLGAPDAWSRLDFVLNPRAGVEPGRDSRLGPEDQLVTIACRPPKLAELLADAS